MRQLARCIAALLLAFLGSSCLATGTVSSWAWEPEVRTEVLGYVESDAGASLIVTFDDAVAFEDGTYEVPVVRSNARHLDEAAPASVVARRLDADELEEFLRAREASRRVGSLPGTGMYFGGSREHVDVYQRTSTGLLRVGPELPPTYVALRFESELENASSTGPQDRAFAVVLRGKADSKHSRVVGIAAVPPATTQSWRSVPAVLVWPAAFAIDVTTFPFQFAWFTHGFGESALGIALSLCQPGIAHGLAYAHLLPAFVPIGARDLPALAVPNAASPVLAILAGMAELHRVRLAEVRASLSPDAGSYSPAPAPAN